MEILINLIAVGVPVFLTAANIANLFLRKKFLPNVIDSLIFILGPLFTLILYAVWSFPNWQATVYLNPSTNIVQLHDPISNHATVLVLSIVAILGYIILRVKKVSLPPLVIVLCMSAMYIGVILSIVWILQLLPNINYYDSIFVIPSLLLFFLFPFNFVISTISLMRIIIKQIASSNEKKEYRNRLMAWLNGLLSKSGYYPLAAFVLMWPLFGIVTAVLVLFGQQPDAAIRAFTDTSGWLFSQKISPPPIVGVEAEYLCTAAARGHKRVVKPIRKGLRGKTEIIVNRQLCVANAFEEMLHEKMPRLQKLMRRTYDAIGAPLANRIKTPIAADIAYIVIKPLEWLILIILYLVDVKPENRIARQYLPIR